MKSQLNLQSYPDLAFVDVSSRTIKGNVFQTEHNIPDILYPIITWRSLFTNTDVGKPKNRETMPFKTKITNNYSQYVRTVYV